MKKVVLLVLVLALLTVVVCADSVKTRIHGNIDPLSRITLTLSYYSQGVKYDQTILKESDNVGNWEYKLNSDPVEFELDIVYGDIHKEFTVPAGPDFEVHLFGEPEEEEESEGTAEEETEEEETEEEQEVEEEEQEPQETAPITGQATGESKEFDFGNLSIYLIILVLFITMVIANIVSAAIVGLFRGGRGPHRDVRNIKVTKLSEKLAKIKEKEDRIKEEESKLAEELEQAKGE